MKAPSGLLLCCGFLLFPLWVILMEQGAAQNEEEENFGPALQPVVEETPPELAGYMSELGRLTHKMALAADADNRELAQFYRYESQVQLETIQREVPEYEGHPIALLVGRMALPAFARMETILTEDDSSRDDLLTGLDTVVQSCNQCHQATDHGFLKITRGTESNPFNQSFAK
ncbi:hypothetical protein [Roseibacillus ishigakijimensis]|uniref:Cytochrome C n=1 Tax=Roseibacillus ishigakijimensis TaxID=454146 RepID=A0A934RQ32_9BACT|nr:hypothetical protein [Roseibacillus ishigakijimensis]MBK1835409.1 hypothetical protein [Roseibacillus ishigakijimensis]